VIVKKTDKRQDFDIHFWHGNEATADEKGSAAALSTIISDYVKPTASRHHLEEQEYETDLFMSYFKQGILYKPGGIESGFKKVEDTFEPCLYLVKGKRYPRAFPKPLTADSLNDGDCFLLDMNDKIYLWYGSQSNIHEKQKCVELSDLIREGERQSKCTKYFPSQDGGAIEEEFWAHLGGKPAKINPPVPDEPPAGSEEEYMMYKLWHVSDATGKLEVNEIAERPLKKEMLSENDSYILELYNQVYVWQGHEASTQEKKMGVKYAQDFVKSHNKPKGCRISRVPSGCEDSTFKSYFENFRVKLVVDYGKDKNMGGHTHKNQDIDGVAEKHVKAKQLAFEKLGTNYTKTVYYLDNFENPVKIEDPREHGKFFAESNYIIDIEGAKYRYII
jgi:hypothetical protein